MSSRAPGRVKTSGASVGVWLRTVRTGVSTAAGVMAVGAPTPSRAARKKSERDARAGDKGVCGGNSGDGTGGRIALMPTGLMKSVGKGLTP